MNFAREIIALKCSCCFNEPAALSFSISTSTLSISVPVTDPRTRNFVSLSSIIMLVFILSSDLVMLAAAFTPFS